MCHSCCGDCQAFPPARSSFAEPYILSNFLPAGVVTFRLNDDALHCEHKHVDDGWHQFAARDLLQRVEAAEDELLLRWIDFLALNQFILPTCRRDEKILSALHVRLYLIPYDLPGARGELRARHSSIVKEAGKALRGVMARLMQDENLWQGRIVDSASTLPRASLPRQIDNRTTTRIYSDLPSPDLQSLCGELTQSQTCVDIPSILSGGRVKGLRSSLFGYQAESVLAMLGKETNKSSIPDPLYIPLPGMNRQSFHLRPGDMEILKERPTLAQAPGGVLCEELGTGKTVMVLALILATLDQMSQPEESIWDPRPVMTPLSFRNFPFIECTESRRRLRVRSHRASTSEQNQIPSLTELLLHYVRVHPESTGMRGEEHSLEHLPIWRLQRANCPFYYHFKIEVPDQHRVSRKPARPGPRKMYLTSASLIVVPINLVGQWDSEIHKHCDATLRVFIGWPKVALPRASELASNYDIVLLSHNHLSLAKADVSQLYSWNTCVCPTFPGARVPDCHCDEQTKVSPLLQVRWKRLVVDEGHVSAAITTNLSHFTSVLSAERRWIVTGTPTTNLLGLSFGSSGESESQVQACQDTADLDTSSSDTGDSVAPQARKWTADDREDLRKLGTMISHFVRVPHLTDASVFNKYVVAPLFHVDGPLPGAIQVLTQVMSMIMIRHRIEDVEKDVVLPPLRHETVLLDLDPYALKSYNALQAVIAINAIDSERVDRDYLFHPSNVDALLQVTENITQTMFWHTDAALFSTEELSRAEAGTVERAIARGVSKEDTELLTEAFQHIRAAASDPLWRAMQAHPDVQYRVQNMPFSLYRVWSRLQCPSDPSSSENTESFLQPDRVVRLREMVLATPLASERILIRWGQLIADEDRAKQTLHLLHEKSLKSNRKKKEDAVDSAALKAIDVARKEKAPEKVKEVLLELEAAQERLARAREGLEELGDDTNVPHGLESDGSSAIRSSFLARSPVAGARIGWTTSSKLDYVLREVMQYASTEKFLIFSKMTLSLAYIAEGLDVIGVRYLQFTSNVDVQVRRQLVMTFQSSDKYRVFLMDLKHGARGLNLTAASRIIFCEPVWQADVESQAIKRAHRIGQTKPITVKTLAIRSTSEEAMVARREALKDESGKMPSLVQESGMRHFIAHPKFLKQAADTSTERGLDMPLLPVPDPVSEGSTTAKPSSSASAVQQLNTVRDAVDAVNHSIHSPQGPPTKKRTIRFADVDTIQAADHAN